MLVKLTPCRVDPVEDGSDGPRAQGRVGDHVHVDARGDFAITDAAVGNGAGINLFFKLLWCNRCYEPRLKLTKLVKGNS